MSIWRWVAGTMAFRPSCRDAGKLLIVISICRLPGFSIGRESSRIVGKSIPRNFHAIRKRSLPRVTCRSLLLLVAVSFVGCGGSGAAKAPVKGKVVANGQPVTRRIADFCPRGRPRHRRPGRGPDSVRRHVRHEHRPGRGMASRSASTRSPTRAPDAEVTETTDGSDPLVKHSPYAGLVVKQIGHRGQSRSKRLDH